MSNRKRSSRTKDVATSLGQAVAASLVHPVVPELPPEIPSRIFKQIAKRHADKALRVYVDVIEDAHASNNDRMTAATHILNRAYGLPQREVNVDVKLSLGQQFEDLIARINGTALDAVAVEIADLDDDSDA